MPPAPRTSTLVALLRAAFAAGLVSALAACGGSTPAPVTHGSTTTTYTPPGPSEDPWGPYIREASLRFDVPEQWIRAVMKVESGGRTTIGGRPTVSRAGAMGLMQVMPATYAELRQRHGLSADPHEPRSNILAGTAYLRDMYDQFGSPGFLAAYNAGPGRYGEFLTGERPLPQETRNYVRLIAPEIEGHHPSRRAPVVMTASAAEMIGGTPPRAMATPYPPSNPTPRPAPVVVASAPLQPPPMAPKPLPVPAAPAQSKAAPAGWGIQVGAFRSPADSQKAIEAAQRTAPDVLRPAQRHVMEVNTASGQFYRARLVGFSSSEQAANACRVLTSRGTDCMTVSPS